MTIVTEGKRNLARVRDAQAGDDGPARVDPAGGGSVAESAIPRPPSRRVIAAWRWLLAWLGTVATALAGCDPLNARPASVMQVWRKTAAGGWVPGDHPWYWEAPGYFYGFVIAVPLTAIANTLIWVGQAAWRVGLAWLLITLLTWAWS